MYSQASSHAPAGLVRIKQVILVWQLWCFLRCSNQQCMDMILALNCIVILEICSHLQPPTCYIIRGFASLHQNVLFWRCGRGKALVAWHLLGMCAKHRVPQLAGWWWWWWWWWWMVRSQYPSAPCMECIPQHVPPKDQPDVGINIPDMEHMGYPAWSSLALPGG